jgi:hypothetical protein
MATKPEDRQAAIDLLAKTLLAKTTGHTEDEAQEVATAMVDEAISQREAGGRAPAD